MPELRTDWLTGRSVLVAENRARRPNEFEASSEDASVLSRAASKCPFCAGNESQTPSSVYEKRDRQGKWLVRVVPNAFPAVDNMSGTDTIRDVYGGSPPTHDSYKVNWSQLIVPVLGAHEVFIESPLHHERMTEISMSHLREIVKAFVHRLRFWRDDGQCRYGLIFKNHGPRAGASLTHVHSQLIAFVNHVPEPIATEVSRVGSYYLRNSECAYCRYIQQERADHNRVVFDDDGFIAFCPFASWQPHETWLMPTEHASSFELAREDVLDRLVVALHRLFALLETIAPNAQYNMILRTAPWDDDYETDYHWRIELLPRVNPIAGLEMATGTHINPLAPELAASELRAAQVF